jgi:hypothetical protein
VCVGEGVKLRKTATNIYQDLINVCGDDHLSCARAARWLVHFEKAGNQWRMIHVQVSQFPLYLIKMWRKRATVMQDRNNHLATN